MFAASPWYPWTWSIDGHVGLGSVLIIPIWFEPWLCLNVDFSCQHKYRDEEVQTQRGTDTKRCRWGEAHRHIADIWAQHGYFHYTHNALLLHIHYMCATLARTLRISYRCSTRYDTHAIHIHHLLSGTFKFHLFYKANPKLDSPV